MTDERLLCHCTIAACTERATQEDGLCDTCRTGLTSHSHYWIGEPGADPPVRPARTTPSPTGVATFLSGDVLL